MKRMKWRLMKVYERFTAAAFATAVLGVLALAGGGEAQAAPVGSCDIRLRVELTPDVPNPRDPGFVSSLLGDHPDYQLTLLPQDPEDASVIALDLTGSDPVSGCREVISSMRKDARVVSVHVQRDAADTRAVSTGQPMGTVHAGPDGDWVLKRSGEISLAEQARVRYECDIWAVEQTGFDPTEDGAGVPPDEFASKREDYLRAEAACFEAHGYVVL